MLVHRPTFGRVILAELALESMGSDSIFEVLIIGCHRVVACKIISSYPVVPNITIFVQHYDAAFGLLSRSVAAVEGIGE
jgi:hypothetical protein